MSGLGLENAGGGCRMSGLGLENAGGGHRMTCASGNGDAR